MALLGLDIGTTGCKAVVFAWDGRPLASSYREYPLEHPAPGRAELDVPCVWQAVVGVLREVTSQAQDTEPITAMGISALGDSVTPVDGKGRPLARAVVGSPDRRAIAQAQRLEKEMGRREMFRRTGTPVHPMAAMPKIMWFREHESDLYTRTWKFVGWPELIQLKLGLAPATDPSQACRSLAMDLASGDYADDLLAAGGIERAKLPAIVPSAAIVGALDEEHAAMVGLPAGAKVVAGGFDQACAALGVAAIEKGTAALSLGTTEVVTAVADRAQQHDSLLAGGHGCGFHVLPDRFISLAYIVTAGAVLRWYRDTIASLETQQALTRGSDPYEAIIASSIDQPAGVFLLPYFAGTGTPWLDANQKGAIFGLQLDTGRDELAKAILDGLCYELRINLQSLADASFPVQTLRATGGGAKSAKWMQLTADVTRTPIETMRIQEAGCFGAAMLAGLGTGVYTSAAHAADRIVPDHRYDPRETVSTRYDQPFDVYRGLLSRVRGLVV